MVSQSKMKLLVVRNTCMICARDVFGSFHQNHSRFYLNKLLALVVVTGDCNTCRPGFANHSIKNATKPTSYDASHLENKEFKLL